MYKLLTINYLLTIQKKEDKMTRLLIPMRVIADVVITVTGLMEIRKMYLAYRLKKQQSSSSNGGEAW